MCLFMLAKGLKCVTYIIYILKWTKVPISYKHFVAVLVGLKINYSQIDELGIEMSVSNKVN